VRTVALLLAGGASRRMGRLKQLEPLDGRPLLQHALDNLCASRVDSVLLVVGCQADRILQGLNLPAGGRVGVVRNPAWEEGMATSLVAGLKAARQPDAVLVALGDMPEVPGVVVDRLLEEAERSDSSVVAPVCAGRRGHPVLFGSRLFPELMRLRGDGGAAQILRAHPEEVLGVPVDCPGVLHDVDRPGDLVKLGYRQRLPRVVLRGGGDLATGVAHRLFVAGFPVTILELPEPRMIRRTVCFAEAVYRQEQVVEGVRARLHGQPLDAGEEISVLVDPDGLYLAELEPGVLVDARMLKRGAGAHRGQAPVVVGLGPGFVAGEDVHFVVETQRGHDLGRVLTRGAALPDTGVPGVLGGESARRVVRAPAAGILRVERQIGEIVRRGERLGWAGGAPVLSALDGILRGLLHEGLEVRQGEKIADVDPRGASVDVHTLSDKSRAIGGGVLEAVMRALFGRADS